MSVIRRIPELSEYEKNRMDISDHEWQQFDQQWVALSLDGRRILAGAEDLVRLKERLAALGVEIGEVGLEFVDFEHHPIGGQAEVW